METIVNLKGRITIPSKIRKQLGIEGGTYLQTEVDMNRKQIVLTPVTREYICSLRGKYKAKGLIKAFIAEKRRQRSL